MRAFRSVNWPGTVLVCAVLLAWELAAWRAASPTFPGVAAVAGALGSQGPEIAAQMAITLARAAAGFGLALVAMLPLGIFLGRTPRVRRYVEPTIDLLRPLPPLAIVPVAMLFAGTGSAAKISVVFYSAAFPILLNAIDATRSTHPQLIHVGRSIGLSRLEIMRLIDLPSALPQIMAGVRIGMAVALLVSVSSEMLLSTDGIGNYLMRAQEQFNLAGGLAGILVIAVVSLCVNKGSARLERRLLGWHHARNAIVPS